MYPIYIQYMCFAIQYTVLVKSFAHLISRISCDPPEGGRLTFNMIEYEKSN